MQHDKMNDLKRPEVKVGRKEKDKCGEQLAERSIYLAEPEVCFWCFLPVKTLENWEPIYICIYNTTRTCLNSESSVLFLKGKGSR